MRFCYVDNAESKVTFMYVLFAKVDSGMSDVDNSIEYIRVGILAFFACINGWISTIRCIFVA